MHTTQPSVHVATFRLAAALEAYEMNLHALARRWRDAELRRRLREQFREMRLLGASLPQMSVSWIAVLVSRARMLQAFFARSGVAGPALQDHLRAVAALRTGCLRLLGAQGAALT